VEKSYSGGFFDDLLVSALDGAVAFEQVDGSVEIVDEYLHFHMPGANNVLFDQKALRTKRFQRLTPS